MRRNKEIGNTSAANATGGIPIHNDPKIKKYVNLLRNQNQKINTGNCHVRHQCFRL